MIGIIDYGMGNLRSVENALRHIGEECLITSDPDQIMAVDRLILPGVGAFRDCMNNIEERSLTQVIRDYTKTGRPFLGICLGMQMMFESSEENGLTEGLGLLKGHVVRMETDLPVPQIGWNELVFTRPHPLRDMLRENAHAYYVHSYYAKDPDADDLLAYSMYGDVKVTGLVLHDRMMGCQFHPEKSAQDGLQILRYFAEVL